jgi:transposase InsO family protein
VPLSTASPGSRQTGSCPGEEDSDIGPFVVSSVVPDDMNDALIGVIRTILTDNGKEFTDRLFGLRKCAATGEHDFDQLCAALEIEHRLTPPKSPQTNGMVERFNGRIKEVLQSHHFRSGEELETTLHLYVWLYNQQLPQSALGSKTPLQAMKDWHKLKPELFKKQPYYLPGCDK